MPLLDLAGTLPERDLSFSLNAGRPVFLRVIMALDRMTRDTKVGGLLLRLGALRCGLARLQELRAALLRFKKKGKRLIVYATSLDLKSYYIASVADKIFLNPAGQVWMGGLASRHIFWAKALKRIGVKPQFVKFGKYKTAPNTYTQEDFTPAHKEATQRLLDGLFQQLNEDLATSRKKDKKDVTAWFTKGLYSAAEAKKAKLVNDVFYWDEFGRKFPKHVKRPLSLDPGYLGRQIVRDRWHGYPRIAVIYVDGAIVSGNNVNDPIGGVHVSGSQTLIRLLVKTMFDRRVRAVVLRVNSPGGGLLASDLIWRYVDKVRRRKPVIVSMGDVAASGGYYVSAPATEIFASPGTITGSIGIFAGKFDFLRVAEEDRSPSSGASARAYGGLIQSTPTLFSCPGEGLAGLYSPRVRFLFEKSRQGTKDESRRGQGHRSWTRLDRSKGQKTRSRRSHWRHLGRHPTRQNPRSTFSWNPRGYHLLAKSPILAPLPTSHPVPLPQNTPSLPQLGQTPPRIQIRLLPESNAYISGLCKPISSKPTKPSLSGVSRRASLGVPQYRNTWAYRNRNTWAYRNTPLSSLDVSRHRTRPIPSDVSQHAPYHPEKSTQNVVHPIGTPCKVRYTAPRHPIRQGKPLDSSMANFTRCVLSIRALHPITCCDAPNIDAPNTDIGTPNIDVLNTRHVQDPMGSEGLADLEVESGGFVGRGPAKIDTEQEGLSPLDAESSSQTQLEVGSISIKDAANLGGGKEQITPNTAEIRKERDPYGKELPQQQRGEETRSQFEVGEGFGFAVVALEEKASDATPTAQSDPRDQASIRDPFVEGGVACEEVADPTQSQKDVGRPDGKIKAKIQGQPRRSEALGWDPENPVT